MPLDYDVARVPKQTSLRAEVLELISEQASRPTLSDGEFRAKLRHLVVCNRRPAEELWDKYHSDRSGTRAEVYSKYCY
ncbi:hypothetical protein [Amaricoccus tamworthensis]|uniref:hypothetical protein n=1 Tax=Amaricoccus tamworthensis TaxID=57002 RepID=UPI003C7D37D5